MLKRGANVALTQEIPGLRGVVLGVRWNVGAEKALDDNLVMAAMLCTDAGKVLSGEHFVFFNQLVSSDASVAQLPELIGDDQEQIEVRFSQVPPAVDRVVVLLYLNEGSQRRRSLGQLHSCSVRVLNLDGNAELARSEDLAPALFTETALVLGELYRHAGGWKFRVVGQGYDSGIKGVAEDFGVPL